MNTSKYMWATHIQPSQSSNFLPHISKNHTQTQPPFLIPYFCEDCFDTLTASVFVLDARTLCRQCFKRNALPSDLYYEFNHSINTNKSSQNCERLTEEDWEQTAKGNPENMIKNCSVRNVSWVWNLEQVNPYLILLKQIDSRSGKMGQVLIKKYNETVQRVDRQIDFMKDMKMEKVKSELSSSASLWKQCMNFMKDKKEKSELKVKKFEIVLRLKNPV